MPNPPVPRHSSVLVTIEPGAALAATAEEPISFSILRTDQVDGYERREPIAPKDVLTEGFDLDATRGDDFAGTARRAAKTSIAEANTEDFENLNALVNALTPDDEMIALGIPDDRDSDRVEPERRNVRLRAFIYAASRERDNDFHVIIGVAPESPRLFMNVEVSGLPTGEDDPSGEARAALSAVRDAYKTFFGRHPGGLPGTRYDFYAPPVPVLISGSLFFDVTHATGGRPGPEDLRGDIPTIWEIHPVTALEFGRG